MIRYFEAFAGLGAFCSAFEKVGGFECVVWCEIDRYSQKAQQYRMHWIILFEKAFSLYQSKGTPLKYENLSADKMGRHNVDGKNIMLEGSCEVDVIFDSGEELKLYFLVVNIDDESSKGTGLRYIYLSDSDTGEIYRIIGEYEEYRSDKAK